MKNFLILSILSFFCLTNCTSQAGTERQMGSSSKTEKDTSENNRYSWLQSYEPDNMLVNRIPVPKGFVRMKVTKSSFADWLRHIPLKPGNPEVMLYNGSPKSNQTAQAAVLNIDVGNEDLQQCADAVMRLKAEYHFSKNEPARIHFRFTSGDPAEYSQWIEGYRPVVKDNKVSWVKKASKDRTYKGFRSYMNAVFRYAGTSSLTKEMNYKSPSKMQPGDVFIKGGFPGHAVIVMDMAVDTVSGDKLFMLAQSYMPAQDIHILRNPDEENTPWYRIPEGEWLHTPEWTFKVSDLKSFTVE